MSNTKHNKLWFMPLIQLQAIVSKAQRFRDIFVEVGMSPVAGNYLTLQRCLTERGVDFSHIPRGRAANRGLHIHAVQRITLEEALVEGSTYSRCNLKKRLIKAGLLENKCAICGCLPEWRGKPLVLVLDHKNGIRDDNRIGNLRLICPNCNSQTVTFCGRRPKYASSNRRTPQLLSRSGTCDKCGGATGSPHIKRCRACYLAGRRKFNVSTKEFKVLVDTYSYEELGRRFGVSGGAIAKRAKLLGVYLPRQRPRQKRLS